MKRNILFFIIAATLFSCREEALITEQDSGTPSLSLIQPAANEEIAMLSGSEVIFEWKAAKDADGYVILFSLTPDMTGTTARIETDDNLYKMTFRVFDKVMNELNIPRGIEINVYWSVYLKGEREAETQTQSIKVNRQKLSISLGMPDDKIIMELDRSGNITFSWLPLEDINEYQLVISLNADFSNPQFIDATSSQSMMVAPATLDEKLAAMGVKAGEAAPVYWTVRPKEDMEMADVKRTMLVFRVSPPPVNIDLVAALPVVLDKDQTSTQTTFSWSSTGAEHYTLIFSKNADMSNPIYVISGITSATCPLTHQQLQDAFIENASLGLKRFKTNILYWNVKADGAPSANSAGQFALSGMRYFRDVRGSEDLTYNVAVLPYPEGSETVWLGENLKTLKTIDGTDIATLLGDNFVASAQSVLETVPVPVEMHPFIGCYYRIEQLPFWKDRVIPAKWKIPTYEELTLMCNQARMAAPGAATYSVLRNPVAFPATYAADPHKEMWNLWKMDFVPYGNGASVAAIPDQQYELDNPYLYFVMDYGSDDRKMFFGDANGSTSNWAWANHAVPIRLIYTGDDE
ncbi:MAG: SusE domain-containing protein [Bacteroidales bacterium]|jgi:hypothetical protein|nr:SusE domain-containing protein [Bacteroidales bacterium]